MTTFHFVATSALLLLGASNGMVDPPGRRSAEVSSAHTRDRVAPPATRRQDAVRTLRSLTLRAKRSRDGLDTEDQIALRELMPDLRAALRAAPVRRDEINLALLELAALRWTRTDRRSEMGTQATERAAQLVEREFDLQRITDVGHTDRWLAKAILTDARQSDALRLAAARALRGRHIESTRSALLRAARTEQGPLRDEAIDALSGWPDPLVHQYFLDALEEGGAGIVALRDHLKAVGPALDAATISRLRDVAGRLYLSEDWRDASRARVPLRALDTHAAVPVLLEALQVWKRRESTDSGSRRTLLEIVRELQRLSGYSFVDEPRQWNSWWTAVLEDRVQLPETLAKQGLFVTTADFFGLQVASNRVLFVIDRSASMNRVVGTDGRTRFDEAIRQFRRFSTEAGADLRFGLVLFSDRGKRWRSGLVSATPDMIDAGERWLNGHPPDGATQLYEGIRAGLRLDKRGRLESRRDGADTVVILCDGATALGPSWVEPWIERENESAQIVFHAIQIGNTGDGTLEALTRFSQGEFVRVND